MFTPYDLSRYINLARILRSTEWIIDSRNIHYTIYATKYKKKYLSISFLYRDKIREDSQKSFFLVVGPLRGGGVVNPLHY